MNVAAILSKAYRITNCNSTTFLDGNSTNVLVDLNTAYGHRTLKILKVRQDLNPSIIEAYTNLISTVGLSAGDNGYNGEYAFDSTTLRPVRIEVSYDGLTWKPCDIYDLNENPQSEFDEAGGTFSTSMPMVRFERDSYFIRPTKDTAGDITGGIHIWYEGRQTDLTTDSPAFEANLHDVLAYDLAEMEAIMHPAKYTADWWTSFRAKKADLENIFNDFYKNRLKRTLKAKTKNTSYA